MKLAVCFSGRIGSGKTSVSNAVAEQMGGTHVSFGDTIRLHAQKQGLNTTSRSVLQDLGQKLLLDNGPEWLCAEALNQTTQLPRDLLIIDGIRHVSVLEGLAKVVPDHRIVLVYISVSDTELHRRGADLTEQRTAELHATEADTTTALRSRAALEVSADSPLSAAIEQVCQFIQKVASDVR